MLELNRLLFLGRVTPIDVAGATFYMAYASDIGIDVSNWDSTIYFKDFHRVSAYTISQIRINKDGSIASAIYESEVDDTKLLVYGNKLLKAAA